MAERRGKEREREGERAGYSRECALEKGSWGEGGDG